jgi:hypothetical protein
MRFRHLLHFWVPLIERCGKCHQNIRGSSCFWVIMTLFHFNDVAGFWTFLPLFLILPSVSSSLLRALVYNLSHEQSFHQLPFQQRLNYIRQSVNQPINQNGFIYQPSTQHGNCRPEPSTPKAGCRTGSRSHRPLCPQPPARSYR